MPTHHTLVKMKPSDLVDVFRTKAKKAEKRSDYYLPGSK
ncbi:hypothetical protein RSAG8_13637, partial [Rhizoctonia solani AG-8 WAC10335]